MQAQAPQAASPWRLSWVMAVLATVLVLNVAALLVYAARPKQISTAFSPGSTITQTDAWQNLYLNEPRSD